MCVYIYMCVYVGGSYTHRIISINRFDSTNIYLCFMPRGNFCYSTCTRCASTYEPSIYCNSL